MSFHQLEILSKVRDQLRSFEQELNFIKIVPLLSLSVSSCDFCNDHSIKKLVSQIKKNDCPTVYSISCANEGQRKLLIDRYRKFHVQNSALTRGKDRLNISKFNQTESETLYLGSSMNDLPGRIKQHLGAGNFRTYGLHLSKWASDLSYDIMLDIYIIRHNQNKELERSFVELIEQALWDHYKPIFGKKSGL